MRRTNLVSWGVLFHFARSIVAALALVQLARDLGWVAIDGVVVEWLDAYRSVVSTVNRWLFGRINVAFPDALGIGVSIPETHLLVVAATINSAMIAGLSANVRRIREAHWGRVGRGTAMPIPLRTRFIVVDVVVQVAASAMGLSIYAIVAALFEDPWGLGLLAVSMAVVPVYALRKADRSGNAAGEAVVYLFGVVCAIVTLLVVGLTA